jgi:hypothetical protein
MTIHKGRWVWAGHGHRAREALDEALGVDDGVGGVSLFQEAKSYQLIS